MPETQPPENAVRQSPRTDKQKLDDVVKCIAEARWTIPQFLKHLFSETRDPGGERGLQREQKLSAFLSGRTKITVVEIVDLMYNHRYSAPKPRTHDSGNYFSSSVGLDKIKYAQPALSTWAFRLVCDAVDDEARYLCGPNSGMRVRATTSKRPGDEGDGSILHAMEPIPGLAPVREEDAVDFAALASADMEILRSAESGVSEIHGGATDRARLAPAGPSNNRTEPLAFDGATGMRVPNPPSDNRGPVESTQLSASERVEVQKKTRKSRDPLATWRIFESFSIANLSKQFRNKTPVLWNLLHGLLTEGGDNAGDVYCPKDAVCTSVICELANGRNSWTNLFPLVRSITHFATMAHQSTYRVGSRLAQCAPYSTLRSALITMAAEKRATLQSLMRDGIQKPISVVLDNVQAYARRRDRRIGSTNQMITGTGATAIELEDYEPNAFDLEPILERIAAGERRSLTTDMIVQDIDVPHLDKVFMFHWLEALVSFVPALAIYRTEVNRMFIEQTRKHQINPKRHTVVHPLGTNGANEVSTHGMKQAISDFLSQLGITKDTFRGRIFFFHGDGKSFEGMHKVKKYLSSQMGHFSSWRLIRPVLELWHTKWTDLSRICRGYWGGQHSVSDPSTLGFMARIVKTPTPADLHKVDFYPNAHLVDVVVRGHVLHTWEQHLQANRGLIQHFEELAQEEKLPSIQILLQDADYLSRSYAGEHAYVRALEPTSTVSRLHDPPCGPKWNARRPPRAAPVNPQHVEQDVTMSDTDDENGTTSESDVPIEDATRDSNGNDESFQGDWPLANTSLLLRDGIFFLEFCRAVALGDVGRAWEVMKVWIFTFAGAGNSNYTPYLVELYCNFKFEYPEATRKALFNNWLVNLQGKPGHFFEIDLMQEHFNELLEELAQNKGKEFDDTWYREILSMHVFNFLRLTQEMEKNVDLTLRRRTHTAPSDDNELLEVIRVCREHDLHRRREGRDLGFHAPNHFADGYARLSVQHKLEEYIEKTMQVEDNKRAKIDVVDGYDDLANYLHTPLACVNGQVNFTQD